jgi:hypothetical protein
LHGLRNETATINQRFKHVRPEGVSVLHNYHAIPTVDNELRQTIYADESVLYKLHAFPTDETRAVLRDEPKVVLLRDPKEIVLAEKRATESLIHGKREEFEDCSTEEEWLARAREIGLYDDLDAFYTRWQAEEGPTTLIVHYEDLVGSPQHTVNRVESFLGLPESPDIRLKRERYSGSSKPEVALQRLKRLGKKIIRRVKRKLF